MQKCLKTTVSPKNYAYNLTIEFKKKSNFLGFKNQRQPELLMGKEYKKKSKFLEFKNQRRSVDLGSKGSISLLNNQLVLLPHRLKKYLMLFRHY